MKPYPAYKDSGVEWLGEIPDHWRLGKLKFVAAINPSKNGMHDKYSSDLATFLPMEKVGEDGTFQTDVKKPISELWSGFTYFEENDVILAKITPCFENGKGAHLNSLGTDVGFGSTEFHVLREISGISNARYLYYLTRSHLFRDNGEAFMTGSAGQKRVPTEFIREFRLGIPPTREQWQIAEFLNERTAKIDALIAKKRWQIELLQEQRAALINQSVTKGLDRNRPMKDSGVEWIGEIPAEWKLPRLKFVADVQTGLTLGKNYSHVETGDHQKPGANSV